MIKTSRVLPTPEASEAQLLPLRAARHGQDGALLAFREDYPMARAFFVHPGTQRAHHRGIEIVPVVQALKGLDEILGAVRKLPKKGAVGRKPRTT